MINGEPIDAGLARLITENDRIQFGSTVIRLEGIGVNKPPITVEEIEAGPLEKMEGARISKAFSGEERRSRVFKEMNFVYDLVQLIGESSDFNQLLGKVTGSLFETFPRIDRVSAALFDDDKNEMQEIVSRSKQDSDNKKTSYTRALADQVMRDGKIVTLFLKADAARDGFTNAQDTLALMAVICLPLMIAEKVRGVIYIEGFEKSNPVRQEDFLLLKTVKRLLELSLELSHPNRGAARHSRNRKRP
jgi:transcriptional regulator with GAF, ATPase, and Fis domain